MNIIWVNKDEAEKVWPMVEPFLVSALKRWLPVYFSCDLLDMVKKDELQLWIIADNDEKKLYGASLTALRQYPRARMMEIFMLGGKEMRRWKEKYLDAMEMFANSQKCDFIQATGRRGWIGFRGGFESAVVVNKVLT